MKLLILSDLHATLHPFTIDAGLEYDIAVLAGDILEPGRDVAKWIRKKARVGRSTPVVHVAGNHEFYGVGMASELGIMRSCGRRLSLDGQFRPAPTPLRIG